MGKHTRRFTAALLALVFLLMLASCGKQTDSPSDISGGKSADGKGVRYLLVAYPDEGSIEIKSGKMTRYSKNSDGTMRESKWDCSLSDGVLSVDDDGEWIVAGGEFGDLLFFGDLWYLREGSVGGEIKEGRYIKKWNGYNDNDYPTLEFRGNMLTAYNDYYNKEEAYEWIVENGNFAATEENRVEFSGLVSGEVIILFDGWNTYVREGSEAAAAMAVLFDA